VDSTVQPDSPALDAPADDAGPVEPQPEVEPEATTPDAPVDTSVVDVMAIDVTDAGSDATDAPTTDSTTAPDAPVDASDAAPPADADASDASDATADAADAHPVDAAPDTAPPSDAGDAATCTPLPDASLTCNGSACSADTQYCLFGSVPNQCLPIPPECQCAETHNCACLLAHATPCDGGTFGCTDFGGGQLWYSVGAPHGPCL
jgi:hypothetical protein